MLWRKTKQKVVMQAHEVEAGHWGRKETRKKVIDGKDNPRGRPLHGTTAVDDSEAELRYQGAGSPLYYHRS